MLFFRQKKKSSDTTLHTDIERQKGKRFVLLGTSSVGKTCLAYKYIQSRLINDPYLTDRDGSVNGMMAQTTAGASTKSEVKSSKSNVTIDQIPSVQVIRFLKEYLERKESMLASPDESSWATSGRESNSISVSNSSARESALGSTKDTTSISNAETDENATTIPNAGKTLHNHTFSNSMQHTQHKQVTSNLHGSSSDNTSSSAISNTNSTSSQSTQNSQGYQGNQKTSAATSTQSRFNFSLENSLHFSRSIWIYQQLIHEVNEIQRFQLLNQAKAQGSDEQTMKDILSKHEEKLLKEKFLLNERLKEQIEFDSSLTNHLQNIERNLISLQDKWMTERNEKVELELERDRLREEINNFESSFLQIANFLHNSENGDNQATLYPFSAFSAMQTANSDSEYLISDIGKKDQTSEYEVEFKSLLSIQDSIHINEDAQSTNSYQTDSLHEPIAFEEYQSDDDSSTSSESVFSLSKTGQSLRKRADNDRIFCPPTKQLMSCVRIFNFQSQKAAINSMIRCGFIADDPRAVAIFLIKCGSLDPKRLGEYLGDERNQSILQHYATYLMERLLIKFPFDIALKAFVQSIRLPKEGQQVSRITEAFSDAYTIVSTKYKENSDGKQSYAANSIINGDIKDRDNAFLLACSILMLNVDLHSGRTTNPPMTRDQFVKMFNDDEVSHAYLRQVYNNLKEHEWRETAPQIGDETEDLYPPEVEQESHALPLVKSTENSFSSDDQKIRTSVSMTSLLLTDLSVSQNRYLPIGTSRSRTRSVHQRQKSKSFDINTHSRQDIPLYFSVREFSRRSIHTFQIRDTASFEWSTQFEEGNVENPLLIPESTEKHILRGDFFLCLYNTRNRSSFTAVEHIYNHISQLRGKDPHAKVQDQVMIVAVDFSDDSNNDKLSGKQSVPIEEGHNLALRLGIPFISVRILKDQEVRYVFQTAVQYCLRPVSKHMNSLQKQLTMKSVQLTDRHSNHSSKRGDPDWLPFGVKKVTHQIGDHTVDVVYYMK